MVNPPPTPNKPAVNPAAAPINKYMSKVMDRTFCIESPETEQRLLCALLERHHATPQRIICKSNTRSTNDDMMQLHEQGVQSALVISHQQSHGRGQHQREWLSPQGNIFLSALFNLERPVDGRFALECGLNILHTETLDKLENLQIKWANDLYSPQGKWGGILVEPINAHQVIVGIGINVVPFEQRKEFQQATTSLSELGLTDYDRIQFLTEIYLALTQAVQWFNFGSQNLAQRFNAVATFKDQWVNIQRQHQADLAGYFQGIQDDGAMLIRQDTDATNTVCYDGRLMIP